MTLCTVGWNQTTSECSCMVCVVGWVGGWVHDTWQTLCTVGWDWTTDECNSTDCMVCGWVGGCRTD